MPNRCSNNLSDSWQITERNLLYKYMYKLYTHFWNLLTQRMKTEQTNHETHKMTCVTVQDAISVLLFPRILSRTKSACFFVLTRIVRQILNCFIISATCLLLVVFDYLVTYIWGQWMRFSFI